MQHFCHLATKCSFYGPGRGPNFRSWWVLPNHQRHLPSLFTAVWGTYSSGHCLLTKTTSFLHACSSSLAYITCHKYTFVCRSWAENLSPHQYIIIVKRTTPLSSTSVRMIGVPGRANHMIGLHSCNTKDYTYRKDMVLWMNQEGSIEDPCWLQCIIVQ